MAYGVVHQFAGGTKEQYDATRAAVYPSDGSLPEGQVWQWRACRPRDGRSSRSMTRRRAGRSSARTPIMPQLQAGIDGGFAAPPEETTFEVDTQVSA